MKTLHRWIALGLLVVIVGTPFPAAAQGIPVFDVLNLAKIVEHVEQVTQTILKYKQQYEQWMRIGQGLGLPLGRFKIPGIPTFDHYAAQFQFGAPWIQALDSGDPRGTAYYATAQPLSRQVSLFNTLTAAAQKVAGSHYATIEILDSVAMMGAHQSAIVRGYSGKVQTQIDNLEGDVTTGDTDYHELTAVADKIAVGEVLGRRLEMANNQLLSNALEQLVAKSKRQRDAEAEAMNGRINLLQDEGKTNRRLVEGADRALTTWRQP
jgi:hypothetical protein